MNKKLSNILLSMTMLSGIGTVQANESTYTIQMNAMPLSEAVVELSETTNLVILAPDVKFDQSLRIEPLVGDYTAADAFRLLLEGSGLTFEFTDSNTVVIRNISDQSQPRFRPISFPTESDYQENLDVYQEDDIDQRDIYSKADEIVVIGNNRDLDKTKMSRGTEILLKSAGSMNDPIWAILSMPSVSIGDGEFDKPIIRGSGPDDNLFLIDDMEVGYLYHALSDSVVSRNIVHNFDLQAAAFGAEYGNATGGVVDVALRNPTKEGFKASIDISMLKAGGIVESPITENSGFYVDFRYNTAHLFLTHFEDNESTIITRMPKSFDYTGRYRYENDGFAITLTALGAQDQEEEEQNENVISTVPLGNTTKSFYHTQGIKIEKDWNNGHYLKTTLSHTRFENLFKFGQDRFENAIRDGYYVRANYTIETGSHVLSAGANFSHVVGTFDYNSRRFYCDDFNQFCAVSPFNIRTRKDNFDELEVYLKDTIEISDKLRLEIGTQFTRDFFLKENFVHPRAGIYYDISDDATIYVRAGRYNKRPELDRLLTLFITQRLQENETSEHYLIGNRWDFADDWYVKTEGYYKTSFIHNFPTDPWETEVEGEAYGAELLLARTMQEEGFYGWLSMSYSESKRVDRLTGRKINFKYSRPVNITAAVNYAFRNGWNIGAKYSYQSGSLYTPVNGVTLHPDGYFIFDYGPLYSARTKSFQRIDVRVEKESSYDFADVTYYVDMLNLAHRKNLGALDYPPELVRPDGQGGFIPQADEPTGIPFFIGFGVNLSF